MSKVEEFQMSTPESPVDSFQNKIAAMQAARAVELRTQALDLMKQADDIDQALREKAGATPQSVAPAAHSTAPLQPPRLTHADIHDAVQEVGLRPTFDQSWKLNELLDQKPLRHREEDFPGVEVEASDETALRPRAPRV